MPRIYLDYAATSPVDPEVQKEMFRVYQNIYGNPSSLHTAGYEALKILKHSREVMARVLNARPEEIIFTGGGSEADNLAVKGVAFRNRTRGKHLISTEFEHSALKNTLKYLEENHGFEISWLPLDETGIINLGDLEREIRPDTTLVSIMYANNEIGTILPVREIGRICHKHGVLFHTDAVQAFCKVPIDIRGEEIDLLSAAAHKIYGPKGVGLLYVHDQGELPDGGKFIEPIIHGGGQEFNLRAGTQNIPGIAGFAKAVEMAYADLEKEMARQVSLRDYIASWILERIPNSQLNGHPTCRLPNNINVSIAGISGRSLVFELDYDGICVSTGSACSSKDSKPSHVLTAIHLDPEMAQGSLRITIGKYTTRDEVDFFLTHLKGAVEELRKKSQPQ